MRTRQACRSVFWGAWTVAAITLAAGCPRAPPASSVPATTSMRFPEREAPMHDAPDFAPLLAAASLERFAWSRDEDSYHVRRGESLTVTFNRAVVPPLEVGRVATTVPLELSPR